MDFIVLLLPHYIPHLIGFCVSVPFWMLGARLLDMRDERERTEAANYKREIALIDKHIAVERARRVSSIEATIESSKITHSSEVM